MALYSQYKSEKAREKAFASHDFTLSKWPVPYETRFVETSLGSTHMMTYGPADAPPLVLIHGHGSNATMWYPLANPLAKYYRVYALDTIGDLGKSAGIKLRFSADDYSNWLNEVFEKLGINSARVAGISEGGWIAFHFGLAFPKRVDRLALLAPGSLQRIRARMMLPGTLAMFFPKAIAIRSLFRYIAAQKAPIMPDWAMDDLILRWQVARAKFLRLPVIKDDELSALEVPTLILLGSNDPIYDAEKAASRVHSVAPKIKVEIIPNAGHIFTTQHPEVTSKALINFFA
ncbi:MAG: alpha/beta hydrolase [Chloroflexota bacterium]